MLFIVKLCIKKFNFCHFAYCHFSLGTRQKRNISSVGRNVFWQLFLLSREKSCYYNDAKIRCSIRLHIKRIN